MIWLFLFTLLWFIVGSLGFIFWWTTDADFTTNEIGLTIGLSILGPFTWLVGWMIHGSTQPTVIFRKWK